MRLIVGRVNFLPALFVIWNTLICISERKLLVQAEESGTGWFVRVAVEPEIELCGPSKFYCPSRRICVPRAERCVVENLRTSSCPDQAKCYSVTWNPTVNFTGIEDRLEDDGEMENRFFIYRAYSSIFESGGSSGGRGAIRGKRRTGIRRASFFNPRHKRYVKKVYRTLVSDPWKHSFIQYRGFTYEFGKYGVQELDINDPNYKYDREWTAGWEILGVSRCGRNDLWHFIRMWNAFRSTYLWYANNCHSFTNAFIRYLVSDCLADVDALLLDNATHNTVIY